MTERDTRPATREEQAVIHKQWVWAIRARLQVDQRKVANELDIGESALSQLLRRGNWSDVQWRELARFAGVDDDRYWRGPWHNTDWNVFIFERPKEVMR